MGCFYHPDRGTVGGCVDCGQLICVECRVILGGKSYCKSCVDRLLTKTRLSQTAVSTNSNGQGEKSGKALPLVVPDKRPRTKASRMKIMTGILAAIIVALVVGFVPLVEASYEEPLDYQEQSHVKREDFAAVRRAIMSAVGFSSDPAAIQAALMLAYPPGVAEIQPIGYVSVTNTDVVRATFRVRITFSSGGEEYTEEFELELGPRQTEQVHLQATQIHYDKDKWSWWYEITPDTKTATHKVPIFEYLHSRFQG